MPRTLSRSIQNMFLYNRQKLETMPGNNVAIQPYHPQHRQRCPCDASSSEQPICPCNLSCNRTSQSRTHHDGLSRAFCVSHSSLPPRGPDRAGGSAVPKSSRKQTTNFTPSLSHTPVFIRDMPFQSCAKATTNRELHSRVTLTECKIDDKQSTWRDQLARHHSG